MAIPRKSCGENHVKPLLCPYLSGMNIALKRGVRLTLKILGIFLLLFDGSLRADDCAFFMKQVATLRLHSLAATREKSLVNPQYFYQQPIDISNCSAAALVNASQIIRAFLDGHVIEKPADLAAEIRYTLPPLHTGSDPETIHKLSQEYLRRKFGSAITSFKTRILDPAPSQSDTFGYVKKFDLTDLSAAENSIKLLSLGLLHKNTQSAWGAHWVVLKKITIGIPTIIEVIDSNSPQRTIRFQLKPFDFTLYGTKTLKLEPLDANVPKYYLENDIVLAGDATATLNSH